MKLIVRDRRPGDPKSTMSFFAFVHLMCRAEEGDQAAIDRLNRFSSETPRGEG